jgi:hypothetical protein
VTPHGSAAIAIGHLDKPDIRIVRFRLAYDLCVAVEQHLGDLYAADIGDAGYDFVEIVQEISNECLKPLVIAGEIGEPVSYHDQIENGFRKILTQLKADPRHMHFVPVVQKIAGALRANSPEECAQGLHQLNLQAWQYFQDMIGAWGGPHAVDRKQVMLNAGPAGLNVRAGDRDFTYCHYLRTENEIRLLAGTGQADLLAMLDLPFYFLHEYVSHAFPYWDDERWRFSEAYLLRAAYSYLDEHWSRADRIRRHFLGLNFDALRAKTDARSRSDLKKAEDCCRELYDLLKTRFFTHLLEWATLPADDADLAERGKVLSGFHTLVRQPATLLALFQTLPQLGAVFDLVNQRLTAWTLNDLDQRKQRQ